MKKIVIVLLLLCSNLYAISGFTYWWNVNVSKDTVTAVKLKNNYDSIKNWSARISDTLNRTVVHFNPGSLNKTNVVKYVNIDTIRSNPNIDSISGGTYLESISTPSAGITRENVDTLHGRVVDIDSGTIRTLKGAKTFRDTNTFLGGSYFSGIGRFAGTLYAPVVDIDSMIGDVKIGGSLYLGRYTTPTKVTPPIRIKLDASYADSSKNCKVIVYEGLNGWRFGFAQGQFNNGQYHIGADGKHEFCVNDTVFMTVKKDSVKVNGTLTTTTINTGNGDCEVYPMNQDVRTTASPTFVNVTSNLTGIADSAKKAGTATNVSGGTVDATTGTFSGAFTAKNTATIRGTVTLPDCVGAYADSAAARNEGISNGMLYRINGSGHLMIMY